MNINKLISKGNTDILNKIVAILIQDILQVDTTDEEALENIKDLELLINKNINIVKLKINSSMVDGEYSETIYQSNLDVFELKIDLLGLKYPENQSIKNVKNKLIAEYLKNSTDRDIYGTKDLFILNDKSKDKFYYSKNAVSPNKILKTYEDLYLMVERHTNQKDNLLEINTFWKEYSYMFPFEKISAENCVNILNGNNINQPLENKINPNYKSAQVINVLHFLQDKVAEKLFLDFTLNPNQNVKIVENEPIIFELYKWLDESKIQLLKNEWTQQHIDIINAYSHASKHRYFLNDIIKDKSHVDSEAEVEKNKARL